MSTPRLNAAVERLVHEGPIRVAVRLLEAQAALSSAPPESIESLRWHAAIVECAAIELGIKVIREKWPTGAFKGAILPQDVSSLKVIKYLMQPLPDHVSVPGVGEVKPHITDRKAEYPGVGRWLDV